MTSESDGAAPLPRVLAALWQASAPPRRPGGLSRDRIVAAAIDLADADGLGSLSMARLAERLGCGTMSLYRHVSNRDELLVFMLSAASDPPPLATDPSNWRASLEDWANGLWQVYHRHPWILQASSVGPPADPGQLSWLDAGLSALGATALGERDKLAAVLAVLHYARGAAALAIDAGAMPDASYPRLLERLVDADGFPALSTALGAGVFDDASRDPGSEFLIGLAIVLDGVGVKVAAVR